MQIGLDKRKEAHPARNLDRFFRNIGLATTIFTSEFCDRYFREKESSRFCRENWEMRVNGRARMARLGSILVSMVANECTIWHSSGHNRVEDTTMAEPQKKSQFDGPHMRGTHYKRADMAGTNFDGVNLAEAQFYAVLTKARFTDTNLTDAVFDDINLADARFNNVNLSGAVITNANLSRLTISGVTFGDSDIKDADLTGMRINGVLVTDLFAFYEQAKT